MLIIVNSATNWGMDTIGVQIEVNLSSKGLPGFDIVGLAGKAISEAKHRVVNAILNSGFNLPTGKITINLAPGDIPKNGSCFDLSIAVGILAISQKVPLPSDSLFFGELSLDGSLRHTKGALLLALYAKEYGFKNLFIPISCIDEVKEIEGINIYPIKDLTEQIDFFTNEDKRCSMIEKVSIYKNEIKGQSCFLEDTPITNIDDILFQMKAKRALTIAAAGGHNLFMIGPPGSGKTMLAKSIISILPPLTFLESLDVTKIHSIRGILGPNQSLLKKRPFRSPHHSVSYVGMIGGGSTPMPGEISLAHRGVLFLDEFSEFQKLVTESLRQPLEDGVVNISRSMGKFTFPAKFILIAASNPCPCGFLHHPSKECICSFKQISNYKKRISGPIMDRIDIHVNVSPVEVSKFTDPVAISTEPKYLEIRNSVIEARNIQQNRFVGLGILNNSEMTNSQINLYCQMDTKTKALLENMSDKFAISARVYFKIIKIARTIADLADTPQILFEHMAEALQYRYKMD